MEAIGLSAVGLAYHSGISANFVYKIVKGDRPNISAVNLASIAHALGVSMEYLVGVSDSPEIEKIFDGEVGLPVSDSALSWLKDKVAELAAITRKIDRLSADEQMSVLRFIDGSIRRVNELVSTTEELGRIINKA
jgi:transcriptional regulator with XRE-family HTH domain